MATFNVNLSDYTLNVDFGEPGTNQEIVKDAFKALKTIIQDNPQLGGPLLKITGRCSLPAAFTLAALIHTRYSTVAVFDPKLQGYVVAFSNDPETIGDLV